ncbi:MAG TPA: anti-sigma factor [Gemmatimonadaceae bacterium]|nr:anti-sigma factor [Gemmatimonadaceae bacterium]
MQPGTPESTAPPPIDCETAVRRLWDYLDGRLPAMSHREVEAHLASCELCPPHFAFAAEMRKALATSSQSLSSGDEARLRLRVRGALERVTANGADDAAAQR